MGELCVSCPIACCVSPEIPPSGVSCAVSLRGIISGESRVFGLGWSFMGLIHFHSCKSYTTVSGRDNDVFSTIPQRHSIWQRD
jgi:hypothetical protein